MQPRAGLRQTATSSASTRIAELEKDRRRTAVKTPAKVQCVQLRAEIPVLSSHKEPFIECIIPLISGYNQEMAITVFDTSWIIEGTIQSFYGNSSR